MARIHPSEMGQAHALDEKHHEHGREHHRQWEKTITRAASSDVGAVALSRAQSGGDPPSRLHQGDENRVMHGEQNGDPLPVTLPSTVPHLPRRLPSSRKYDFFLPSWDS